jgi:site-specific DNA-methyltransferase (adenine-specific)
MTHTLHHGDCLDILRTMADASVDAIVTDPPYGLAFMGKRWDYDVPSVEVWAECLRVLKPGGHLLAFAGTRTQHRMAVRIEDAGFEIRDMIAWAYGSGFPKSMDVSKAIDKLDASEAQQARRYRFTEWVRSTGLTAKQIDEATSTNMGGHYTTAASQPAIMTLEHLDAVRHMIGEVPEWVERECEIRSVESENFKQREVVGQAIGIDTARARLGMPGQDNQRREYDITAPATPEAQQWAGWGTALKPALEPITMARKPLTGTVAANVLEHGTGALNVDGCRVGTDGGTRKTGEQKFGWDGSGTGASFSVTPINPGRWPANLIHDGSDEPSALLGDAARFFYTAKASAAERQGVTHPTVKPHNLMAYLCRLVTPPSGIVLDPFMGSGTTIKAAISEGFQAVGIERDPAYFAMAQQRMDGAQLGLQL